MKKWLLSLVCLGAVSLPASALALNAEAVFDVTLFNGITQIPVGQMKFDLDSDIPGFCRYYVEWDDSAYLPISADGYMLEGKAHGRASCRSIPTAAKNGLVRKDQAFPLFGFDRFQQYQVVEELLLGESPKDGEMHGIIQFTTTAGGPPSFMPNSITITVAGP